MGTDYSHVQEAATQQIFVKWPPENSYAS